MQKKITKKKTKNKEDFARITWITGRFNLYLDVEVPMPGIKTGIKLNLIDYMIVVSATESFT